MTRKQGTQRPADRQVKMQEREGFLEELTRFRRLLHAHPETAFEEEETARRIVEYLAQAGIEPVADQVAGTGLLFRLQGERKGPSVMLEADLDALPLTEQTGKEYTSNTEGVHHACGHDGHMTMLVGALTRLNERLDEMPGEVYALFQPAEETGQGAGKVLEDPRVRDLKIDAVYGIHNLPGHPLGTVVIRPGAMASASVGVHFRFEGETSHAAAPHEGRSAVAALAQLSLRAPALSSQVLAYGRPGLITPIHLEAGKVAFGTAAGSGDARFTVRAARDEEMEALRDRLVQEAQSLADMHSLVLHVEEVEPFPATVNDPEAVRRVEDAARRRGLDVQRPNAAQAWSEDFGHFNTRWRGALICLGSGPNQPELHRPDFDFPDELLPIGVGFWVDLILNGGLGAGQDERGSGDSKRDGDQERIR